MRRLAIIISVATIASICLMAAPSRAYACVDAQLEWRHVRIYSGSQPHIMPGQSVPSGTVIAGDLFVCGSYANYEAHQIYRQNMIVGHQGYIWWTKASQTPAIPGVWRFVGFFRQVTFKGLNVMDGWTAQTGEMMPARFTWIGV